MASNFRLAYRISIPPVRAKAPPTAHPTAELSRIMNIDIIRRKAPVIPIMDRLWGALSSTISEPHYPTLINLSQTSFFSDMGLSPPSLNEASGLELVLGID